MNSGILMLAREEAQVLVHGTFIDVWDASAKLAGTLLNVTDVHLAIHIKHLPALAVRLRIRSPSYKFAATGHRKCC